MFSDVRRSLRVAPQEILEAVADLTHISALPVQYRTSPLERRAAGDGDVILQAEREKRSSARKLSSAAAALEAGASAAATAAAAGAARLDGILARRGNALDDALQCAADALLYARLQVREALSRVDAIGSYRFRHLAPFLQRCQEVALFNVSFKGFVLRHRDVLFGAAQVLYEKTRDEAWQFLRVERSARLLNSATRDISELRALFKAAAPWPTKMLHGSDDWALLVERGEIEASAADSTPLDVVQTRLLSGLSRLHEELGLINRLALNAHIKEYGLVTQLRLDSQKDSKVSQHYTEDESQTGTGRGQRARSTGDRDQSVRASLGTRRAPAGPANPA